LDLHAEFPQEESSMTDKSVQAPSEEPQATTAMEVLSDVDPVVLEVWKLKGQKGGAMLADAQAAVIELQEELAEARGLMRQALEALETCGEHEPPYEQQYFNGPAVDVAVAALRSRRAASTHLVSPGPSEPASPVTAEQQAVLDAASQWTCERQINDWDEADLMKAVFAFKATGRAARTAITPYAMSPALLPRSPKWFAVLTAALRSWCMTAN
jgi:hypothetical protein